MNNKKWLVRVKTLEELNQEYPNAGEYSNDSDEVYQLIARYGGCEMKLYLQTADDGSYSSNVVINDEELDLPRADRYFFENELEFLSNPIYIELEDDLFEL